MGTYNNTLKVVKDYEVKFGGLNKQVTELTAANQNLGQIKIKIEKDLAAVTRDYQDIAKELKLADDRANKAGADAGHFESLLREEQNKVVKNDSAKKALENEVRSLSVRIEEIETNSVATSKRTIQKLEVMINEEKKSHAATMSELHTKTRSIKELILQSEEDRRISLSSKNLLTNLMRKLKCTRDNLKNRRPFPTPTLCVSRSSSVSSKALKQEQRKPNPHLTNSDQENVFLLLHQFVLRNPLMSRNLKSL